MTDTSPAAVERFSPSHARLGAMQPPDAGGDYVRHSDYATLSTQLEAANAELARISRDNEFEAWASKCQRERDVANQRADAAYAKGKADGLREAAAECDKTRVCAAEYNLPLMAMGAAQSRDAILALIPADTPACDTKTAENVPQDDLCKSNAVQEAAGVVPAGWGSVPHMSYMGYGPTTAMKTKAAKLEAIVQAMPGWIIAMADWDKGGEAAIEQMEAILADYDNAEPAQTVQEAAKVLLDCRFAQSFKAVRAWQAMPENTAFYFSSAIEAALRAIAGGKDE